MEWIIVAVIVTILLGWHEYRKSAAEKAEEDAVRQARKHPPPLPKAEAPPEVDQSISPPPVTAPQHEAMQEPVYTTQYENDTPTFRLSIESGMSIPEVSTEGTETLPDELRKVVIEIDSIYFGDNGPGRQERREHLKSIEWDLRIKLAKRWSGVDGSKLPIKSLTFQQNRLLNFAAAWYGIRPEYTWEGNKAPGRNIKFALRRSVASLEKHGFLKADERGTYWITDTGLQALETLPTIQRW